MLWGNPNSVMRAEWYWAWGFHFSTMDPHAILLKFLPDQPLMNFLANLASRGFLFALFLFGVFLGWTGLKKLVLESHAQYSVWQLPASLFALALGVWMWARKGGCDAVSKLCNGSSWAPRFHFPVACWVFFFFCGGEWGDRFTGFVVCFCLRDTKARKWLHLAKAPEKIL